MRTRKFNVPADLMTQFAGVMTENDLNNTIVGYDLDADEITVEVDYEADQKKMMHDIQDKIDEYNEENEKEDDEDDEENDDD